MSFSLQHYISRSLRPISKFFSVLDSLGIGELPRVTVTPIWPLLPGQPEVGPNLKSYTTDLIFFFSYRFLSIKFCWGKSVTPFWPLLLGTQPIFKLFFSYRLLGHSRLVWNTFDPMLTFTSGSTGSGPISQEVQSQCSNFSYRL